MGRNTMRILLFFSLMALTVGLIGCQNPDNKEEDRPRTPEQPGYRSVCFGTDAFIAVGTGGRMDRIAPDKTVTPLQSTGSETLNGVAFADNRWVAVGNGGAVLTAGPDGAFRQVESGTKQDLLAVAGFGSAFVAVGRCGTVLTSVDGTRWSPFPVETDSDFISVDSNGETCLAVTRQGQVLIMKNLSKGDILDYNAVYQDLATTFYMRAISCCGQGYLVMGTAMDDEDVPVLFRTSDGEIWSEIYLDVINNGLGSAFYPLRLNGAAVLDDQILVGAEGGKLLTLTSCAECTKLQEPTDKSIRSLAYTPQGYVLLAGDDFWFDVLSADSVRTYSIKAEQARTDQRESGAYIVDVRTPEEYIDGHIPGALHIPLDRVADQLERLIPNKETKIIFYCAVGGRSQTALETALAAGYSHVYNLGGLEKGDWPYDLAFGEEGVFEDPEATE